MFGFLIKTEVNDDVIRFKTLADQVLSKYMPLTRKQLEETIPRDLPSECYYIDRSYINFIFYDFREFQFILHIGHGKDDTGQFFSVQGRGKYAGFMLHVSPDSWHCSVSDGILYRATGGAKKLAQLMQKKFGIQDMTRFLKRLR